MQRPSVTVMERENELSEARSAPPSRCVTSSTVHGGGNYDTWSINFIPNDSRRNLAALRTSAKDSTWSVSMVGGVHMDSKIMQCLQGTVSRPASAFSTSFESSDLFPGDTFVTQH